MAPQRSEGATKGLRVLNYVVSCVLMSNFLDPYIVLVPWQLLVTRKQRENVAVISSNIAW